MRCSDVSTGRSTTSAVCSLSVRKKNSANAAAPAVQQLEDENAGWHQVEGEAKQHTAEQDMHHGSIHPPRKAQWTRFFWKFQAAWVRAEQPDNIIGEVKNTAGLRENT